MADIVSFIEIDWSAITHFPRKYRFSIDFLNCTFCVNIFDASASEIHAQSDQNENQITSVVCLNSSRSAMMQAKPETRREEGLLRKKTKRSFCPGANYVAGITLSTIAIMIVLVGLVVAVTVNLVPRQKSRTKPIPSLPTWYLLHYVRTLISADSLTHSLASWPTDDCHNLISHQ